MLTNEQGQEIFEELCATLGLPAGFVGDRLDAFKLGMLRGVEATGRRATLDSEPEPPKAPDKPEDGD